MVCQLTLFNGRRGEEPALSVENYVLLQSLVVCRLTLFNGRRGEEPSHWWCAGSHSSMVDVARNRPCLWRTMFFCSHWWCAGSHCSMVDVARNPVIGGVPAHTVQWQTWRGTQSLVVCQLTLFNGRRGEEPSHWWCAGSHCSMADVARNRPANAPQ